MAISLDISPLFLTFNTNGTYSYQIFHEAESYEPMIGDISRYTPVNRSGGKAYFPESFFQTVYFAAKIKPNPSANIHKLILKTKELNEKHVWCVLSTTQNGVVRRINYGEVESQTWSKYPAYTTPLVYPQPFTREGYAVVLTKSEKISSVYLHEKSKCLYIFGDFEYIVLTDKNYRNEIKSNLQVHNFTNKTLLDEEGGRKFRRYKNFIKVNVQTGELITERMAFGPNQIDLSGDIYCVLGYDKSNNTVYRYDKEELLISGKFNGTYKIKKMKSTGEELPFEDIGLNGPVYTMALDTKYEVRTINDIDNIPIYLGGDFTISSGVTNKNLTRINGDGTLNIIQSTGGGDISFDQSVKCIKMLYGHMSGSDKILFVGGKFKDYNGYEIKKICKFIISNSTGEFAASLTYKPIYDSDDISEVLTIEEYEDPNSDYLLIGGKFTSCGQDLPNVNNIARILISDGSLDLNFSLGKEDFFSRVRTGIGFNNSISKIKIGYYTFDNSEIPNYGFTRIYILGSFSSYRSSDNVWFCTRLLNDKNYNPQTGLEFKKYPLE